MCVVIALLFGGASMLTGYYHFLTQTPSGSSIPQKFDLDQLVDNTVYFYVSSSRPKLPVNDSYEALISQVRQALSVWDAVPTSSLGVRFGGITDGVLTSTTPSAEILFAELPPGVIGLGGPVTKIGASSGFVPITRSQVILSNDLTQGRRRPTYSEVFFTSLVHEIGHALGLQHTMTSAAMSTDVTRAATRARPLAADDVAGLSVLYPTADFAAGSGVLSGTVLTTRGQPVALASVVALSESGAAISGMTAADGRYVIEGVPQGSYLLYAHALPPATQDGLGPANIVLPEGTTLSVNNAAPQFQTALFGGESTRAQQARVEVKPGSKRAGLDFRVAPRSTPGLYNVTTFSFPGNGAPGAHPAFVELSETGDFIVATGPGLAGAVGELKVEVIGADIRVRSIRPFAPDSRFVRIDFAPAPFALPGPKHLIFRTGNDVFVLPAGVNLAEQGAPIVHWIAPDFRLSDLTLWAVRGRNLSARSSVYFDGLAGTVFEFDPVQEELLVLPPEGPAGHRAVVTVYNPDGQSSAFTLPDGNVTFTYPSGLDATLNVSPNRADPNSDLVVKITGRGAHFGSNTIVGFGTSDVVTRQVDVLNPSELRAVVTVGPNATPGLFPVSVVSGLEVAVLRAGFEIAARPSLVDRQPKLRFNGLINAATGQPEISPGVLASLFGERLTHPLAESAPRVFIDGIEAPIIGSTASQINLQVPEGVAVGIAEVVVDNGVARSEPMLVLVAPVSPGLFRATVGDRVIDRTNPAALGSVVTLVATGLGQANRVTVLAGSVRLTPLSVRSAATPGISNIRVRLGLAAGGGQVPISILVNGRRSNSLQIAVRDTSVTNTAVRTTSP